MRKIRFEKYFDPDCSMAFAGPSTRDGKWYLSVECPSCFEETDISLTADEIEDLGEQLLKAAAEKRDKLEGPIDGRPGYTISIQSDVITNKKINHVWLNDVLYRRVEK